MWLCNPGHHKIPYRMEPTWICPLRLPWRSRRLGARYEQGGREDKAQILHEFARITGYHRQHTIGLLGGRRAAALVDGDVGAPVVGVGRDDIYDEAFVATLIVFWETADRISGKRLVPLRPPFVEALPFQ